jgi:integrase
MRIDDVDLLARTITVRGFNVKPATRKVRSHRPRRTVILPIPNRALHYVTELVKAAQAVGSPWLLPSEQDPAQALTPHALSKEFRKHATRAGFADVRFHHALHVFTTRAKRRGLDDVEGRAMREAQAARGHDSAEATRHYDHTNEDPEALRKWYDAMDRWLDEEERIAHDSPKSGPRNDSDDARH